MCVLSTVVLDLANLFLASFFFYSFFSTLFLDIGLKWTSNFKLHPRTILPLLVLKRCLSSELRQ